MKEYKVDEIVTNISEEAARLRAQAAAGPAAAGLAETLDSLVDALDTADASKLQLALEAAVRQKAMLPPEIESTTGKLDAAISQAQTVLAQMRKKDA